jgi:hypothetical protein
MGILLYLNVSYAVFSENVVITDPEKYRIYYRAISGNNHDN